MKLSPLLIPVFAAALVIGVKANTTPVSADALWAQLEPRLASPEVMRGLAWKPAAELAWAFQEAHPTDARRWQAWLALLRSMPRFDDDAEAKRLWAERAAALEQAAATTADAPEALRELFAARKVGAFVLPFTNGKLPADWQDRLVPPIEDLAARFPEGSSALVYFSRLAGAVEKHFPSELPALVMRMTLSPNQRVREFAAERHRVMRELSQPLDLKFTALDGREVDTAKLRGKVVLVDFWATWCVPCIEAMPHLKELHAKYHDRGLEIINISVDRENARPALEKLVARLELPWPQFFDGKGNQTEYAVRYGVQPIPHVLLAGPDGIIVAVNPPKGRLEAEIKRLLQL